MNKVRRMKDGVLDPSTVDEPASADVDFGFSENQLAALEDSETQTAERDEEIQAIGRSRAVLTALTTLAHLNLRSQVHHRAVKNVQRSCDDGGGARYHAGSY